ncbi:RNA polymerase II transcriptional coactivator KIWI-like [Prunus avium]|uniref:RNA polymerase II transcriptional coactivator KIWI-like n=1 Tax=Prunus avium TaxID=42229 RepID=A0A6P5S5U0_PRUAV|nr:RNA polymerase II transcriptional coactivator KIWI-like [Prunus avium]
MSWRGKRKDEEDHASDGDSEGHAPPKKTCKRDSADDNSDEIVACEISKNRRVTVRNWNGKIMVDIREFYVKDGKQMPGKKGISLTKDQWDALHNHVEEIDKAVNGTSQ